MAFNTLFNTCGQAIEQIIAMATQELDVTEIQEIHNEHKDTPSQVALRLAEHITQYRLGSQLIAQEEWNDLTRLQMKHELLVRNLDNGCDLTDWNMRLKLRLFETAKKAERITQYRLGSQLIARGEWNDLTRLQMKHELLVRNLPNGDDFTDWDMRLKLRLFETQQKMAAEEAHNTKRKNDNDPDEDQNEILGVDEKTVYVKSKGLAMVF